MSSSAPATAQLLGVVCREMVQDGGAQLLSGPDCLRLSACLLVGCEQGELAMFLGGGPLGGAGNVAAAALEIGARGLDACFQRRLTTAGLGGAGAPAGGGAGAPAVGGAGAGAVAGGGAGSPVHPLLPACSALRACLEWLEEVERRQPSLPGAESRASAGRGAGQAAPFVRRSGALLWGQDRAEQVSTQRGVVMEALGKAAHSVHCALVDASSSGKLPRARSCTGLLPGLEAGVVGAQVCCKCVCV